MTITELLRHTFQDVRDAYGFRVLGIDLNFHLVLLEEIGQALAAQLGGSTPPISRGRTSESLAGESIDITAGDQKLDRNSATSRP